MPSRWGLAFGVALSIGGAFVGTARAADGVEKAVSFSASLGTQTSDTVREASGGAGNQQGGLFGLTALLSAGPLAVGANADLSNSVGGIGTRTLGGVAGVRLPVGPQLRVLLLGEAGMRRFWDTPEIVFESRVSPGELTLPYVGARAGATFLVSRRFDLGVVGFVRKDLGTGTMTVHNGGPNIIVIAHAEPATPPDTVYQVGGMAAGVSLQVGFRFDTRRPF